MLNQFLSRSQATDAFRAAVAEFARTGLPSARVHFDSRCPPVKVERTLTKMLEAYPATAVDAAKLEARSGCEFFQGTLTLVAADGEETRVRFRWDCKWKAEQQGWQDYFGFADQARAAREFGYDCFLTWTEVDAAAAVPA